MPPSQTKMAIKDSMTSRGCLLLKSLSSKLGGMFCRCASADTYSMLDTKLEQKMIEIKRTSSVSSFKSINSIILKFPQFRDGLKNIRCVFEENDEDANGVIDFEELKKCLKKLQVELTDEEVEDLFHSCDFDGSKGIQFKEFIVLLCLIYLLTKSSASPDSQTNTTKMCSPELEATFNAIVEAFLFLDKNGDGKLNKKDMINSMNEESSTEKSPARIAMSRFKEMDWDRNGNVSFREFLFALVNWVGIDSDEDMQNGSKDGSKTRG